MGGIVISQVAEQHSDRIAALVYVCAFLLVNGQTLLEVAKDDKRALVMPNVVLSSDGASATLRSEILREAFYADCSDQDYEFAKSRLVPQPTEPFASPLHLSIANFGSVPRLYIECLQDRAISIDCQRQMQRKAGCQRVVTLDCSHSPFFSAADKLAHSMLQAPALAAERRTPRQQGVSQ